MATKYQVPDLPATTLAYVAGLVDGEGTITIRRHNRGRGSGLEEYGAWLSIAQKNLEILYWVKELFGRGSVVQHKLSASVKHEMHHWSIGYHSAVAIIEALYPYLRIKRRQAEIVMEFAALKQSFSERRQVGFKGTLSTPLELLDQYRALTIAVQRLNGRKLVLVGPRNAA